MASTVDSKRVFEYGERDAATLHVKLDQLAQMITESNYTVFFTGAGVSTSAGVPDYRGPTGAWTLRKIKELQTKEKNHTISGEESKELGILQTEAEKKKEATAADKKTSMLDAQPTFAHMAQATLIRLGMAHFVVTTNLDGLYRKAGLQGHKHLCNLHGDVYVERCTSCGYDFERNYHVRQAKILHVHDHQFGTCEKCGSAPPKKYTGVPGGAKMKDSKWGGQLIGTCDVNCGTKDTHINFGECLDSMDWNEAQVHCEKADLCIVAGTSMSLRHITHFPFLAKRTVIINLQQTPDDAKASLRIWAQIDDVFTGLLSRLGIEVDPIPVWLPKDALPLNKIPKKVSREYVEAARRLAEVAETMKNMQIKSENKKKHIRNTSISQSGTTAVHLPSLQVK